MMVTVILSQGTNKHVCDENVSYTRITSKK